MNATDSVEDFILSQLSVFGAFSLVLIVLAAIIWFLITDRRTREADLKEERNYSRRKTDMINEANVKHLETLNELKEVLVVIRDRVG